MKTCISVQKFWDGASLSILHPGTSDLQISQVNPVSENQTKGDQTAYSISYFELSWMLVKLTGFFYVAKDSFAAEPTSLQFHMYTYRVICKCMCTHVHICSVTELEQVVSSGQFQEPLPAHSFCCCLNRFLHALVSIQLC